MGIPIQALWYFKEVQTNCWSAISLLLHNTWENILWTEAMGRKTGALTGRWRGGWRGAAHLRYDAGRIRPLLDCYLADRWQGGNPRCSPCPVQRGCQSQQTSQGHLRLGGVNHCPYSEKTGIHGPHRQCWWEWMGYFLKTSTPLSSTRKPLTTCSASEPMSGVIPPIISIQQSKDFSIEQQPVGKVFPCPLAVVLIRRFRQ